MRFLQPVRTAALFFAALPLLAWSQSKPLSLDEVLSRMQQAEAASKNQALAYTVTREYQLGAPGASQPNSDVVAQVNFVPPAAKDYMLVSSEGSDRGAGIVRKVLDHEAAMATRPELHELTARNYDFALLGRESIDGHDCYVLQLSPKREAAELIRGKAWIDAGNFTLRRVDGMTAKSPSLWIKNLHVVINYGQVDGVWLQTSTRAEADVRFVGPHVLTSRELDVQVGTVTARMQTPRTRTQKSNRRRTADEAATFMAR